MPFIITTNLFEWPEARAHSLFVNGKTFVLKTIGLVSALRWMAKIQGVCVKQYIVDDGQGKIGFLYSKSPGRQMKKLKNSFTVIGIWK
jgi:hypothetical protein